MNIKILYLFENFNIAMSTNWNKFTKIEKKKSLIEILKSNKKRQKHIHD